MSGERVSYPRLRSVRFKDGGADLRVMRSRGEDSRRAVRQMVEQVMAAQRDDTVGVAIVVWGRDMGSTVGIRTCDGPISQASVPDFVRTRLIGELVERWTREGLRDDGVI